MILIVDDQELNRKLLSMVLEKMGHDLFFADDGTDALEKVQERKPDLIFMDILMPKMDGYEAAKKLRDRGFKNPIIAASASELSDEYENCLNAGMDDLIKKPFKREDVEKILQKWLNADKKLSVDFTSTTASKSAVFDAGGMLDNFMNDKKDALHFLSRFIERTGLQLDNFPALKEAGDWKNAQREAHTMKGAAFTMGGTELGAAAARLVQACKNASKEEAEAAYPLVQKAFLDFKKEAEEYIRSNNR